MLLDDDTGRAEHPGQQDEDAEPLYRIELENETIGEQASHHHAAAGHVGTDFPACIDDCADDHANQGGYDDAAHIAWQVYAIHRQQAGHVALI